MVRNNCVPCEIRRAKWRIRAMRLLNYHPVDIAEKLTAIYQVEYKVVFPYNDGAPCMFYRIDKNDCKEYVCLIA